MAIAGWEPNEAIKAGRNLRGWTQIKLAERVGALLDEEWSRDMIASIEAGKRTVDPKELVAFVVLLDLDYDYILRGVELELRSKAMAGRLNSAAGDNNLRDLNADNALYRKSPLEYALHPANAGVTDMGWLETDGGLWESLQAETLPIKIAS